ncbi:MAG TPA: DUF1223 domain-containing protein [Terracidiphilus sp.]|jgi:hypothetical protein
MPFRWIVPVTRTDDRESKVGMPSPRAFRALRFAELSLVMAFVFGSVKQLAGQSPSPTSTSERVPVLVELFTSEGCSDCPPADELLGQLDAKQPIAGVQAIVLSEHVTYWNHDGWRDPFSLDDVTDRQATYVRHFGLESSYTPQMVVDGTTQFVGANGRALVAAVESAEKSAKQPLTIENAKWDHGSATFSIHAGAPAGAKLIAALAANATHQEVSSGENKGRTLHHVAVVRVMKEFNGSAADGRALKLSGGDFTRKDESDGPVRLVIFLVDHKTGHVLGAAEQNLSR